MSELEIKSLKRKAWVHILLVVVLSACNEVWFSDYALSLSDIYFASIRNAVGLFGAFFIFSMILFPVPALILYLSVKGIYYDYLLRKKLGKSFWKMKLKDYF